MTERKEIRLGLIGRRLGHSWSQRWFEEMFEREGLEGYSYRLYELPSVDRLRQWVQQEGLRGFNVTVPYKQAILPQLDSLDAVAEAIGAVNCVTVEGGRLIGHNTDAPAFQLTLEKMKSFSRAFILGTGGAARAVAYALGQMGIPYTFVSRTPENQENSIGYEELPSFISHSPSSILINATPVGMYPDIDRSPLGNTFPFEVLKSHLVYDLIYNPSPTLLLRRAAAMGAQTKDGLEMLHHQAQMSWERFYNGM